MRITEFNIEQFGDMLYLSDHKTKYMRLIQSNQIINTNENEILVYFKSDCDINTGKFKIIVDFIQNDNPTTTQSINDSYTKNNNKHTTTKYSDTTFRSYSTKQSSSDSVESTTIDYKITNSNKFETSTNYHRTNKQTTSGNVDSTTVSFETTQSDNNSFETYTIDYMKPKKYFK